jgi:hypothetical protein
VAVQALLQEAFDVSVDQADDGDPEESRLRRRLCEAGGEQDERKDAEQDEIFQHDSSVGSGILADLRFQIGNLRAKNAHEPLRTGEGGDTVGESLCRRLTLSSSTRK